MKTIGWMSTGFVVMLVMGTVYTWSVFRVEVESVYQASALQSGMPYMTSLFFYAGSMMVTGRLLSQRNSRRIALMGIGLITLGWFLAAQATSLWALTMSYGVLIGIGVGMVYGVPVYLINQRYTQSGLYTGIILSGFGASPLVTAPLVHVWLENSGLKQTFFLMGMVSLIVLVPLGFVFKGNGLVKPTGETIRKTVNPRTFIWLYGIFLIGTTIGLMMIGLSYRIGVVNYGFDVNQVAVSMALFAILNGVARPLFGLLVDKKGFVFASGLNSGLIVFAAGLALLNQGNSLVLYGVSMGIFWFSLGGWLAMLPASIKVYFGTHLYAKRYGLMFTSYGFGAILGTVLSGIVLDLFVETTVLYSLVLVIILIVITLRSRLKLAMRVA